MVSGLLYEIRTYFEETQRARLATGDEVRGRDSEDDQVVSGQPRVVGRDHAWGVSEVLREDVWGSVKDLSVPTQRETIKSQNSNRVKRLGTKK